MGRRSNVKQPLSERFKKHVGKAELGGSGCLNWMGSRTKKGYGRLKLDGRSVEAHRVAWLIRHGVLPALCVLHRCDNPSCVNPDHLFLGTRKENVQDMDGKGRRRPATGDVHGTKTKPKSISRGEKNGRARLAASDVEEIRSRVASGETVADLAREKSVSEGALRHIVKGRHWQHVGGA